MARLVFLKNHKMRQGDVENHYRAGLCYEVGNPEALPPGIAYLDGEEPPIDEATREAMILQETKEARLRMIAAKRQRMRRHRKKELLASQTEKLNQALEARRNAEDRNDA